MTLPASIRINAQFPFPALVSVTAPITITKTAGIWTVGFNVLNLAPALPTTPAANELLVVYNTLNNTYQSLSVASLAGSLQQLTTRAITATGNIAVLTTDRVLLMNPTVAAPCNVQLPSALSRFGSGPLTVKDIQGFAAGNNITLTPNGTDTIDGVNAAIVMNDNFEALTLNPLATGGWWIG